MSEINVQNGQYLQSLLAMLVFPKSFLVEIPARKTIYPKKQLWLRKNSITR